MNETSHDEKILTEEWLQVAYETGMDAIEKEDWATVEAVIEDIQREGYGSAAKSLTFEMNKSKKGLEEAVVELDYTV